MQLNATRLLWLILCIALSLRVAAAIAVDQYLEGQGRRFLIEGDANGYWELGLKLATQQPYAIHTPPRYVLRTPGFPLLLSIPIRILGDRVLPATILLAVVGTGCLWLTSRLGRSLGAGTAGLWGCALLAIAPLHVGNSVLILSETWFAFWMLLAMLAFQRLPGQWSLNRPPEHVATDDLNQPALPAQNRGSGSLWPEMFNALLAGLVAGFGVLVRPGWVLWPGTAGLLILVFGFGPVRRRLGLIACLSLGCVIALTPWAWRNHQVTGHWVMTSLWSGPSLYDGLHPQATGASDMQFFDDEQLPLKHSEFEVNEIYKRRAVEFALANPGRAIELGLIKAGRYLSLSPNAAGFSSGPFSLACLAFSVLSLMFLGLGLFENRKTLGFCCFLAAPFVQFLLVHMVFIGSVRYRLPVEFPLAILAGAGIERIVGGRWLKVSGWGSDSALGKTRDSVA